MGRELSLPRATRISERKVRQGGLSLPKAAKAPEDHKLLPTAGTWLGHRSLKPRLASGTSCLSTERTPVPLCRASTQGRHLGIASGKGSCGNWPALHMVSPLFFHSPHWLVRHPAFQGT